METLLQSKLKPEENLLWTGLPEAFETLDKTHKSAYIRKCVIVLAVAAAVILWYINFAASRGHAISAVVIVLVLAIAAFGVVSDLLDANKLRKKTMYALTDMRLIAVVGGNVEGVEYGNIDQYDFAEDEDGHVSLLCGEMALEEGNRLRRTATVRGVCNHADTGRCRSFAMYALDKADVAAGKTIGAERMSA